MATINLTEQDKQEIRLACIAADLDGTSPPAVIQWMAACADLPADTWVKCPPYPRREDLEVKPQSPRPRPQRR
jgi:hypothetical protein